MSRKQRKTAATRISEATNFQCEYVKKGGCREAISTREKQLKQIVSLKRPMPALYLPPTPLRATPHPHWAKISPVYRLHLLLVAMRPVLLALRTDVLCAKRLGT